MDGHCCQVVVSIGDWQVEKLHVCSSGQLLSGNLYTSRTLHRQYPDLLLEGCPLQEWHGRQVGCRAQVASCSCHIGQCCLQQFEEQSGTWVAPGDGTDALLSLKLRRTSIYFEPNKSQRSSALGLGNQLALIQLFIMQWCVRSTRLSS